MLNGIRRLGTDSGVQVPELVESLTSDEVVDLADDLDGDRVREAIRSLESVGLIYSTNQGLRPAK